MKFLAPSTWTKKQANWHRRALPCRTLNSNCLQSDIIIYIPLTYDINISWFSDKTFIGFLCLTWPHPQPFEFLHNVLQKLNNIK